MSKKKEIKQQTEQEMNLLVLQSMLRAKKAHDDLLFFTKFTMPDPQDPDNLDQSRYKDARHHRILAATLEQVEKGLIPRLIVVMPPRHGKSELVAKRFIPWFVGRDPYRQVAFATYNEEFSKDTGRDVKSIMESARYAQVFPGSRLRTKSAHVLETTEGGRTVFVGAGGALTGRGADLLVVDDPIKDAEEAESPTIREKRWEWFTKVAMTRLMTLNSAVVIVMTRWHEDDLVGRLTDPTNPCYDKIEASKWKIIHLAAEALEDDPMGREVGVPLWPEKYNLEFLHAQKRLNPRGYSALYQGLPTPEDGELFKREWIVYYRPEDLPPIETLSIYAASDHAIGTDKTRNDATVLVIVGVDNMGDIWVLDVWWERKDAMKVVEAMLSMIQKWRPITWWAERGHISKAIGPFLKKRMLETQTFCNIEEVTPVANKVQRSQSLQGRMAMKKVRFPKNAHWTIGAIDELMKFPMGRHDDFVDALSWVGMKLRRQVSGRSSAYAIAEKTLPKTGTLAWVKAQSIADRKNSQALISDGY
ncbi:MAG: phage terminase large subunit [Rhodobacteraceae bacterium]|nr:phage terminase large subunit [Paracoccaceae bacterium]